MEPQPTYRPHQRPDQPPAGGFARSTHGGTGSLPGHRANRDLETLRDGMNAPIVYDRARRVYQLEPKRRRRNKVTCSPACGSPRRRPTPS